MRRAVPICHFVGAGPWSSRPVATEHAEAVHLVDDLVERVLVDRQLRARQAYERHDPGRRHRELGGGEAWLGLANRSTRRREWAGRSSDLAVGTRQGTGARLVGWRGRVSLSRRGLMNQLVDCSKELSFPVSFRITTSARERLGIMIPIYAGVAHSQPAFSRATLKDDCV